MAALFFDLIRLMVKVMRPCGFKAVIAENILLRRQLRNLRRARKLTRSPKLSPFDRLIFACFASFLSKKALAKIAIVIQPITILKLHRALVNRKYKDFHKNKKPSKPGPKGPSAELIKIVLETKNLNPHMGTPQLANFINNNFAISTDKNTVARILKSHFKFDPKNNGPSWLSFIGHSVDSLWSIDFFKLESVFLKTHWVMVVQDVYSRRIVGFAVKSGKLFGPDICQMFNSIISGKRTPKYLSMDNDPLFNFHQWQANLRVYEIAELKTLPGKPWSHPYIESLIGTVRHEYTDQILFYNEQDLQRKLNDYASYYNEHRVHSSLNALSPEQFSQKLLKTKIFGFFTVDGGMR